MKRQPRHAGERDYWKRDQPRSVRRKQVDMFWDIFIHRTHPVMLQQDDGRYRKEDRTLTRRDVVNHLLGTCTLGILPNPDGTVKLGVVDVDYASPDVMAALFTRFDAVGLTHLVFASGRKGFHMTVFFEKPTALHKARAVLRLVAGNHEIWPRQDRLEPGRLGNCIKAPLGMHRVTRRGCVAVDRSFMRIQDHWRLVRDIARINPDAILAQTTLQHPQRPDRAGPASQALPDAIKPCLQRCLRQGTNAGSRNHMGYALATEFRRLGYAEAATLNILEEWNRRNRPPMNLQELRHICQSAYRPPEPYHYGCNPDGALRQLVQDLCAGRSKCPYYQTLLQTLRQ